MYTRDTYNIHKILKTLKNCVYLIIKTQIMDTMNFMFLLYVRIIYISIMLKIYFIFYC